MIQVNLNKKYSMHIRVLIFVLFDVKLRFKCVLTGQSMLTKFHLYFGDHYGVIVKALVC